VRGGGDAAAHEHGWIVVARGDLSGSVVCHAEAFCASMAAAERSARAIECPAGTVLEWALGLTPDQDEVALKLLTLTEPPVGLALAHDGVLPRQVYDPDLLSQGIENAKGFEDSRTYAGALDTRECAVHGVTAADGEPWGGTLPTQPTSLRR